MTVAMDQMRAANAQRSYLMFFVLFFLLLSVNDFTPAKTRRNARAGSGGGGDGVDTVTPTRRDEVRDKVRARCESSVRFDSTTTRSRACSPLASRTTARASSDYARARDASEARAVAAGVNRGKMRLTRASMTFPTRRVQVIIDLSESNARLEVENRRLRAAAIGLKSALMKRGGEAEVKEFDDAYNLTSVIASSRNVGDEGGFPQLAKREVSDDAENEIPAAAVKSSRRLLGRIDSTKRTDLHPSWR